MFVKSTWLVFASSGRIQGPEVFRQTASRTSSNRFGGVHDCKAHLYSLQDSK